jgi:hypothetical protein
MSRREVLGERKDIQIVRQWGGRGRSQNKSTAPRRKKSQRNKTIDLGMGAHQANNDTGCLHEEHSQNKQNKCERCSHPR